MASIQGIYLAFFGRPADPLGLAYWEEQTNNGADLSVMLNALSGTEEYQDRFVGMSNEEVIQSIYQMLFGRDAEPDGLAHFLEALENGTQTLGSIAVNILDGAQGSDLAMIENKIAAADLFTASLDTPEEIEAYSGNDAAEFGRQFLSTVTEDPETVPTEEAVQEQINTDLPNYTPDEGQAPGGGGGGNPPAPGPIIIDSTFSLDFEQQVHTDSKASPGVWGVDRAAPALFESSGTPGHKVLHQRSADDPSATSFYQTQGYKYELPEGSQETSIDLFMDPSWMPGDSNEGLRYGGFWGVGVNDGGDVTAYPIIELANVGGELTFRGYDVVTGNWINMGLPADFSYGKFYNLSITLNEDGRFTYDVGNLSYTTVTTASTQISEVILQVYNQEYDTNGNAIAGRDPYSVYWDNLDAGPTVYIGENLDLRGETRDIQFANDTVYIADGVELLLTEEQAQEALADGVEFTGPGYAIKVQNFANDFESDSPFVVDPSYGVIVLMESDADFSAHSGIRYALITDSGNDTGPFTRFDDYRADGPIETTTSIAIYLDPAQIPENEGFSYSVAANSDEGKHIQDFIFHVAGDADGLYISSSNNTNFDPVPNIGAALDAEEVTDAGWYIFEHRLYKDANGNLVVDLTVYDDAGDETYSRTIEASNDGNPVSFDNDFGGNRYGWFTNIDVTGGIRVDDLSLQAEYLL